MSSDDASRHTAVLRIPADHPALPGHFPGNPVVPGVVLLDGVIEAAEQWLGRPLQVRGLRQAKFLAPLAPGDEARIVLVLAGRVLEFTVERGNSTLAKGTLALDGAAAT